MHGPTVYTLWTVINHHISYQCSLKLPEYETLVTLIICDVMQTSFKLVDMQHGALDKKRDVWKLIFHNFSFNACMNSMANIQPKL